MLTTYRGVAAGVAVCILLAGILTALPALGQFTGSYVPEKISRGESANLFASWAGGMAVDGFVIQLPPNGELEGVSVLKSAFHSAQFSVRPLDDGRYEVTLANPLESKGELVIRILPGDGYETERVVITPFSFSVAADQRQTMELDRLSIALDIDQVHMDPDNRVLSFAGSDVRPLIFRPNAVPSLDLHRGFTTSFWMKSTGLNQVVLSTWNGDETLGYPLELIVDPAGRLRCFRGRPGRHQSMGSERPIADGAWHHVVVINEPDDGWMRLQIDGRTVDSLYSAPPPHIVMGLPLAVGGRVPGSEPYFDGTQPYSGFIDAIRIQHITTQGPKDSDPLVLEFDRRLPDDLLTEPAPGVQLILSDLTFRPPVDDFNVTHEDGVVLLKWRARGSVSPEFVVERSKDGRRFEEVHRVPASGESGKYEFRDVDTGEGVAFYRLRQIYPGGAERVSGTIKVGMGEVQPERITLVGNFPNPFNDMTTISYIVREQAHVRISVWDVSGQSVRGLVDRTQGPGSYEVRFDAGDLPSGTYFVRLRSRRGTKSHKMILMK